MRSIPCNPLSPTMEYTPKETKSGCLPTLSAVLPVRMSFSCSGRTTSHWDGSSPWVMFVRTSLRTITQAAQQRIAFTLTPISDAQSLGDVPCAHQSPRQHAPCSAKALPKINFLDKVGLQTASSAACKQR